MCHTMHPMGSQMEKFIPVRKAASSVNADSLGNNITLTVGLCIWSLNYRGLRMREGEQLITLIGQQSLGELTTFPVIFSNQADTWK